VFRRVREYQNDQMSVEISYTMCLNQQPTEEASLRATDCSSPNVGKSGMTNSPSPILSPEKLPLISPGVIHLSLPLFVLFPSSPEPLLVLSCPGRTVDRVSLIPVTVERERDCCVKGVEVRAAVGM
jgi:hypothetical protein